MQEDEQGFLYPHINTTQCIDCGLCNKVCPVFRYDVISNKKNVNPHILALHHHNEKLGYHPLVVVYLPPLQTMPFGKPV